MTALEPSGPSRAAMRRLRLAMAARAAIGHRNLLRAWVIGEGEGRLFVAFQRCPHGSLGELLAAAPLSPAQSARLLDGAAGGVDVLSQRGLVARDLTPDHLLFHPAQGGVLMDLGIPLELLRQLPLEQDRDLAFRSPEERRGQPVDVRSAVYSLGAILFTALTGVRPDAGTRCDVSLSHLAGAPLCPSDVRSELSPEIDAVVARAMAADPAERYADAKTLSHAAAAVADLGPKIMPAEPTPKEPRPRQPSPKLAPAAPQRTARPTRTASRPEDAPTSPAQKGSQPRPSEAGQTKRHPRPADGFGAGIAAGVRRCGALVAAFLAFAGAAVRCGRAGLRRFAGSVARVAREGARVTAEAARRGAHVVCALFLRACRLVVAAAQHAEGLVKRLALFVAGVARRGAAGLRRVADAVGPVARDAAAAAAVAARAHGIRALCLRARRLVVAATRHAARLVGAGIVVAGVAGHHATAGLLRLRRSASSVARGASGRIGGFARGSGTPATGLIGSQPAAVSRAGPTFFGSVPRQAKARRVASIRGAALSFLSHRHLVLPAVGALVASALSGIALDRALEPEGGPSSIARSGLSVQLPPGWGQADFDPGRPALSSAIAAVPSGETRAGFVVGKLGRLTVAEGMLERVQREGAGRTEVRLGALYAWRYAELRPRPHLVGTGYLVPITGGAVLMLCHASQDEARVRLAECDRAATTLVVRGERPHRAVIR